MLWKKIFVFLIFFTLSFYLRVENVEARITGSTEDVPASRASSPAAARPAASTPVINVNTNIKFVDPSFDPICWTEKDCVTARETIFGIPPEESKKGFYPNLYPCVKEGWGKCLPAGATKTSISFGGKTEFANIGDYIVEVYNYALRIAAILAVIMIIIAGVQYVTSGGNSEMISSAKKRITGALIGLFIAYTSYFILNSINPALVSLRLPQIYMIRSVANTAEFCVDLPKETFLAPVPDNISATDRLDATKMKTAFSSMTDFPVAAESLKVSDKDNCGKMYFVKNSPALSCYDDYCKDGVCVQDGASVGKYKCLTGVRMAGSVVNNSFLSEITCVPAIMYGVEGWTWPWVKEEMLSGIMAVCNDGSSDSEGDVSIEDLPDGKTQLYKAVLSKTDVDALVADCDKGTRGGLKGFGIFLQFKELCDVGEFHLIGRSGVDLGDLDRLADRGIIRTFSAIASPRAAKFRKELFFSADEMKKGVRLRIDAGGVHDIDESTDRDVYNSLME